MDGYIFTDYRSCWKGYVDVYRENGMRTNCICIRGDKGQAAELFNRPALLFDDKEYNVGLVRSYPTSSNIIDGVVVRMGRKRNLWADTINYVVNYDSRHWPRRLSQYQYNYGRGPIANRRREPHRPQYYSTTR